MALKTTTQIAIGIFIGLGVYLVYRMFGSYHAAGSPLASTTSTNLQNQDAAGGASVGSALTTPMMSAPPAADPPAAVLVAPSTGPATEARSGRGHF
jgi:hypothetical protein